MNKEVLNVYSTCPIKLTSYTIPVVILIMSQVRTFKNKCLTLTTLIPWT